MTEIDAPRADETVAPDTAATFGRRLAQERERQGLSIDDVAARLRLHPRQVRAIENEALPALPAPFLRGFVRNYAKELRIDPEPLVAELSARLGPRPNEPARADGSAGGPRLVATDLVSRRVVVGGVLAALVALAVLGWLATRGDRPAADATRPAKSLEQAAPASPAATPAAEMAKTDAIAPQGAAPAAVTAPPTDGANSVAVPATAPAATTATPASGPAFDGLRITFREQSWVEVTQADGRIVHSQINAAGTEQRIEARAPLRVVIGNASAVSADYKGKPIDLKPVTNADNVARLTLN